MPRSLNLPQPSSACATIPNPPASISTTRNRGSILPRWLLSERQKIASLEPQLLLPLSTKEKLLGLIALGEKRSEEPYSGSDLRLFKSVAAPNGPGLSPTRS